MLAHHWLTWQGSEHALHIYPGCQGPGNARICRRQGVTPATRRAGAPYTEALSSPLAVFNWAPWDHLVEEQLIGFDVNP